MKLRTAITLLSIAFFSWSCTKSNDETSDPGTPSFELNFTGAMTKKITGTYAVANFSEDQTATGKPVETAVVGLSSKAGELFTIVITREGGIKTGTFQIDFSFDPFFSSSSTYTENSGATLYGAAEGSFKFSSVSDKHINGTVDLELEDGGNKIQVKGKFNAVKP
jgi:hypothetical protein